MKKLLNKKAFTLIETILAVCIFAAIALPLLSVFLQSVKTDRAAKNVLNANYIAQDYIENLDTQLYLDALSNRPELKQEGGYYLTASIKPYGNAGSLFPSACAYVQLIVLGNGSMLAVLPDGKWKVYSAFPASVSLSMSGNTYTLNCDGSTTSGNAGLAYCALVINAMQMTAGITPAITVNTNCQAVIYCLGESRDSFHLTGTGQVHSDILSADTSPIHVSAYVYENAGSAAPVSVTEAYIDIRNWPLT